MSVPPFIRPAAVMDAAAISGVIVEALRVSNARDYSPAVIERVVAGFAPQNVAAMVAARRVLVALLAGEIVGTSALDGSVVRSVFVRPALQRRGVGTALMAAILDCAAEDGTTELSLRSSLTATGFYIRLGFEVVREEMFGEERTVLMRRSLEPAPSIEGGRRRCDPRGSCEPIRNGAPE